MSSGETILVVDDEPFLCEIFAEILRNSSYKVFTAQSGREALELLKDEAVDLLLSDVIMPGFDGYQLAARVRELYPQTKIQLVSGNSETDNHHLVPKELHQQIITKPVPSDLLLERVSELLC